MYDLQDKVVLITGAANGIGAAISHEVLKEGAKHLRLLDIDEKTGLQLQNELNNKYGAGKSKFVKCDVTVDDQLFDAFTKTKEEQGYLDVVFNNAGVAGERNYAAIRKQFEINVIALINGTLKALELMDTKNGGRGGTVINASSIAGMCPICPVMFSYSSTKSAVLQFTSCVGSIQSEDKRVIALCYGTTDTTIFDTMYTFQGANDKVLADIVTGFPKQTVESAARGTIEAYKKGKSASTWLIQDNKPAVEITEDRKQCHDIMEKALLR